MCDLYGRLCREKGGNFTMSKPKVHNGVIIAPCEEHKEVHVVPAPLIHDEDEACPLGLCDEEVYVAEDYTKATSVGYSKKYAANYDKLDWGN